MKKVLIDTNILLDGFTIEDGYAYVVLSHVNRELDKHKTYGNDELKYKTRQAVRFIEDNIDKFEFDIKDYEVKFDENFDGQYTDNKIIQACLDNGYSLMTNDLLLKQKARAFDIELIETNSVNNKEHYKGYATINATLEQRASLYESPSENILNLLTNQYVIVNDENGKYVDTFRWNGSRYVTLKYPEKNKIKAKNHLQSCAIDLLLNKDIPIKIIAGTYGSGKTLLSVRMALHHVLDLGTYAKIMMVRNPIGSGREIGYLKGTKQDKTEGFFKPFIQHLNGGEQEAEQLEREGVLGREIPWFMKGLSIEDTLILCDEAEDLDVSLIKLIGTRLSENSAVVFSGDYKQVEKEYRHNNGLMFAIEKLKDNPLVGIVVLDEDVRSSASKVFANLE